MSNSLSFKPSHTDAKENHEDYNMDNNVSFRFQKVYINNTSIPVHVLHRNNITVPIRNSLQLNYPAGSFIIRTCWSFTGSNIVSDTIKGLKAAEVNFKLSTKETTIFKTRLLDAVTKNPHNPRVNVILDRVIDAREITESGRIYIHDEDVIISTSDHANLHMHPYSSEGVTDSSYYDFTQENRVSGFFVELVDNEQNSMSRFLYTGKRLLEIPPVKDPGRRSGIYYHCADHHPLSGSDLERGYCTLEKAEEEIGVYRTRDEAITGGNPETVSKIELEMARKEAVIAAAALEKSRHETAVIREEMERTKIERTDHFDEKKYRRSDEYDHRSIARKDSSEILKLAVALATGGLAVLALTQRGKK